MQEYAIKRGTDKKTGKSLEERIVSGIEDNFGLKPEKKGDYYVITYGALMSMQAGMGSGGKTLLIDSESDRNADDETILDTNRRFRKYLDYVTGFTSKERSKKMQKAE